MARPSFPLKMACICLIAAVFSSTAAAAVPQRTRRQVPLAKLRSRLAALSNFTARYRSMVVGSDSAAMKALVAKADAQAVKRGYRGTFSSGPNKLGYRFHLRFLDGRLRVKRLISAATLKTEYAHGGAGSVGQTQLIRVWTPERSESLSYMMAGRHPNGTISAPALPQVALLWALGLSAPVSRHWATGKGITPRSLTRAGKHEWLFRQRTRLAVPRMGMVAVLSIWTISTFPHLRIVKFVQKIGRWTLVRARCSEFRIAGGMALPGKIVVRRYLGRLGLASTEVLYHIRYRRSPAENILARYRIKFPVGAWVQDMRTDHTFQITKHPSYLTDHEIFMRLKH